MALDIRKQFKDYGLAIGAAIVTALFIRSYFLEAFRVPTEAMRPVLLPGDFIFASKLGRLDPQSVPARGSIVIYSPPGPRIGNYIKRLVGLPGDSVGVLKGRIVINGRSAEYQPGAADPSCGLESHSGISYPICLEPPFVNDLTPVQVPKGSVFVIGDNRNREASREAPGPVDASEIEAEAKWIWLSIEPRTQSDTFSWIPDFRLDRMFRSVL